MNIAVLTSSRADFGIYLPLLNKIKEDSFFNLEIIAFGTHLSEKHGYTKSNILDNGFNIKHEIETTPNDDSEEAISKSIGETIIKFATFWAQNKNTYDLVLCLGDRYEMFAAVTAGITFNIKFAHIHAGEKTLGAIDNVFRHSITFASQIHFTSTDFYKDRVIEMLDSENKNVTNVGALSLDTLAEFNPMSLDEMKSKFKMDLSKPTILTTFHPETVNAECNEFYSTELVKFISNSSNYQFLITMPNADTAGQLVRNKLINGLSSNPNVFLLENMGSKGYFSAMTHCSFLLGNTSSGIIEAASFHKYVVNLGDRQKGRIHGDNVIDCKIECDEIKNAVQKVESLTKWNGSNPYFIGGASTKIIDILKTKS